MSRALSVLIVVFWLAMTFLLLRDEIRPAGSALREVPASHVVKLILHHQQPSDLNILNNKLRVGHLRIEPRNARSGGPKSIAFTGNLLIILPGASRQRIAWDGDVEMDKDLAIRRFRIGVTTHEPDKLRSEIEVRPLENIAQYELSTPKGVLERQTFTLDEEGAREVFLQLGIDPTMIPLSPQTHTPPVIKARQSSIEVHGEQMDTYLVTVESAGQTWIEFHVDQLGHVVRATTLLGYSLLPDDISP